MDEAALTDGPLAGHIFTNPMTHLTRILRPGWVAPLVLLFIGLVTADRLQAQEFNLETLYSAVVYLEGREIMKTQKDDMEYEVWLKHPQRTLLEPQWVKNIGTGFLVVDNQAPYLVTAAHVARWMDFWAQITIRSTAERMQTFSLVELCGGSGTIPWVVHQEADVAIVALQPSERAEKALERRFLPSEIMVSQPQAPPRSSLLTVVGYPLELGIEDRFFPISQEFRAVSGPVRYPRFDTKGEATFFFVDKPGLYGFSGAPVFEGVGSDDLKVVGLVYGSVSDTLGGQFSAIVPSAFIVDILRALASPQS